MMYRYTYLGYQRKNDVSVKKCDEIYFSVIGYYKERTFIYVETRIKDLDVEKFVEGGDFIPFPDGHKLFRMESIFYCDTFKDESVLVLPIKERQPVMSILMFEHDNPVLAYVAHHYLLQEDGKTKWSRYYSIYHLGNTVISVTDKQTIALPESKSIFPCPVNEIVDITRPTINNGLIPWDDGTPAGWRVIN